MYTSKFFLFKESNLTNKADSNFSLIYVSDILIDSDYNNYIYNMQIDICNSQINNCYLTRQHTMRIMSIILYLNRTTDNIHNTNIKKYICDLLSLIIMIIN